MAGPETVEQSITVVGSVAADMGIAPSQIATGNGGKERVGLFQRLETFLNVYRKAQRNTLGGW